MGAWQFVHRAYAAFMGNKPGGRAKRFLRDTAYTSLGTLIGSVIGLAGFIITTRVLGPAEFGRAVLAVAISIIAALPMVMGYSSAATVYLARRQKAVAGNALAAVLLSAAGWSALLLALSGPLSGILRIPYGVFAAGIVTAAFLAVYNVAEGILRGMGRMRLLAFLRVALPVADLAVLAALFAFGMRSYIVPVLAMLASYAVYYVIAWCQVRPRLRLDARVLKKLTRYGMRSWFVGVSSSMVSQADKVIVHAFAGAASVGIYGAYTTVSLGAADKLASPLTDTFVPMASAYKDKGAMLARARQVAFRLAPALLAVFAAGSVVLLRIIGREYPLRAGFVLLFAAAAAIRFCAAVLTRFSLALGVHGAHAAGLNGMIAGAISIGLNLLLTPKFGIAGAALALIGAAAYQFCSMLAASAWLVRTGRTG
jgi:PST family polysaccharide transporter